MCKHGNVTFAIPTQRPIPFEAFLEWTKMEAERQTDETRQVEMFLEGELDVICKECGEDLTVDAYSRTHGYESVGTMNIEELVTHVRT